MQKKKSKRKTLIQKLRNENSALKYGWEIYTKFDKDRIRKLTSILEIIVCVYQKKELTLELEKAIEEAKYLLGMNTKW